MILYHKSNLVYIVVFPQFLFFQQNNSAQTSVLIFFTSRHYSFFEKLKIVEKQLCKLNCSYGKVSYTLKDDYRVKWGDKKIIFRINDAHPDNKMIRVFNPAFTFLLWFITFCLIFSFSFRGIDENPLPFPYSYINVGIITTRRFWCQFHSWRTHTERTLNRVRLLPNTETIVGESNHMIGPISGSRDRFPIYNHPLPFSLALDFLFCLPWHVRAEGSNHSQNHFI